MERGCPAVPGRYQEASGGRPCEHRRQVLRADCSFVGHRERNHWSTQFHVIENHALAEISRAGLPAALKFAGDETHMAQGGNRKSCAVPSEYFFDDPVRVPGEITEPTRDQGGGTHHEGSLSCMDDSAGGGFFTSFHQHNPKFKVPVAASPARSALPLFPPFLSAHRARALGLHRAVISVDTDPSATAPAFPLRSPKDGRAPGWFF